MKFFLIFSIAIFACLMIWINIVLTNKQNKEFRYFDSCKLNGKITYLYSSTGGQRFRLDNSDREYWFISKATKLSHFRIFSTEAALGDSIQKEPFSEFIILIKQENNTEYRFHIYKDK